MLSYGPSSQAFCPGPPHPPGRCSEPTPPPSSLPLPLPLLPLGTLCLLYANGSVQDETVFFNTQSGAETPRLLVKGSGGHDDISPSAASDNPWHNGNVTSGAAAAPSLPTFAQSIMPGSPGLPVGLIMDDSWENLDMSCVGNFQAANFVGSSSIHQGGQAASSGLYSHGLSVTAAAANAPVTPMDGLSTPPSEWVNNNSAGGVHGSSLYPSHEAFSALLPNGTHGHQRHLQHHHQQPIFETQTKSWISSALDSYVFPQTIFPQPTVSDMMPVSAAAATAANDAAAAMSAALETPSPSPHKLHPSSTGSGGSVADNVSDALEAPFASPGSISSSSSSSAAAAGSVSSSDSNYNETPAAGRARGRDLARGNEAPFLRRSSRTRLPAGILQGTAQQDLGPSSDMLALEGPSSNDAFLPSATTTTTTPRRRRTSVRFHQAQQQNQHHHNQQNQQNQQQLASPLDAAAIYPWPPGEKPPGAPYQYVNQMDPESLEFFERTLLEDRDESLRAKVPFKLIQHKLRHVFCGAQETLRGHHRRLVKDPSQRVRKPVWHDIDVELLRRAVASPRCKFPNGKVSWRAVSQYISDRGGTYDFGITTCSRKWNELTEAGEQ
ncbi:hypothetical protein JDV02_000561 [Purpureocillium takamizusanense]|uniref:Myb-like domain-containing protein n=1 Tax=Purpureocillium takamizusanense TaxID=2060973 RepID=A0A9Q8V6I5_9HYPO|nr:uncharacterized protein JDV02_000561 [Purpureocillium takamizusanense]UNI13864.1 hypothetical protein JDV02_000561 [Purpureocillium takamizusanense]